MQDIIFSLDITLVEIRVTMLALAAAFVWMTIEAVKVGKWLGTRAGKVVADLLACFCVLTVAVLIISALVIVAPPPVWFIYLVESIGRILLVATLLYMVRTTSDR